MKQSTIPLRCLMNGDGAFLLLTVCLFHYFIGKHEIRTVYKGISICYTSDIKVLANNIYMIEKEAEPCQIKEECNLM
jgi:hypothetical protein